MMLTAFISMISMLILVANQIYSARVLVQLHKEKTLLLDSSNQLLQMRRAEKDFMMRLQASYLNRITTHTKTLTANVKEIERMVSQHRLPNNHANTVAINVAQYSSLLQRMAKIMQSLQLGTAKEPAKFQLLQDIALKLRQQVKQRDKATQLAFAELLLAELRFREKKGTKSTELFQLRYQNLEAKLIAQKAEAALALLTEYKRYFDDVSSLYQQLGYNHDVGLQKQFRDSAHRVEASLAALTDLLNPVILAKERNVNLISSIILLLNAAILIFAIAKNFHQLRKSFTSFKDFFEESKHEKTLLNVQEVTFNEFKELALVANDMLEARFKAEEELTQARDKLAQTNSELSKANKELEEFACLDPLTKIANRRQLDKIRALEWRRGIRAQQPYSVILIDIDYFKPYNDNYGHQQGDEALQQVAQTLMRSTKRASDLVARYGGEEFAVVLPNTNLTAAQELANDMVNKVIELNIEHLYSAVADRVTISAGVACAMPTLKDNPSQLFAKADKALYQAKHAGRNRVAASAFGIITEN